MRYSVIQDYNGGQLVRDQQGKYRLLIKGALSEPFTTLQDLVTTANDGRTTVARELEDNGETNQHAASKGTSKRGDGGIGVLATDQERQDVLGKPKKKDKAIERSTPPAADERVQVTSVDDTAPKGATGEDEK